MPDPIFTHPRLAEIYDDLDGERIDLDHYVAIVGDLDATTVLDVGCGTGSLACRLSAAGLRVTGIDPAAASLDVARRKDAGGDVGWLLAGAAGAPALGFDVALMTGNVAQVFVTEAGWLDALRGVHRAVRAGGHFVFESRDPALRGWEEWTRERSLRTFDTRAGPVESCVELTDVNLPSVSFRWTFRFLDDDTVVTSDSTLRFRSEEELRESLSTCGFNLVDVRGAPDRPHRELVVIARRAE